MLAEINLTCFVVLPLIQRHHAYNIKMALGVVIGCVKYTTSVLDERNGRNAINLFDAALRFSNTVQEVCKRMVCLLNYLSVNQTCNL
jgi:hypothetical protein